MEILHLTLKKKWFDMIAAKVKKEEYREIKDYWIRRFISFPAAFADDPVLCQEFDYRLATLSGFTDLNELMLHYETKFIEFDIIRFRNGYSKDCPEMDVEYKGLSTGAGEQGWGGGGNNKFIISLGEIISIKNYPR